MSIYPDHAGFKATDTSQGAAEAITEHLGYLQALTHRVIIDAGPRGLTAHEAAEVTGFDKSAIQPRTSELRRKGKIVDSGQRRINPTSGKPAIVWVAADLVKAGAT